MKSSQHVYVLNDDPSRPDALLRLFIFEGDQSQQEAAAITPGLHARYKRLTPLARGVDLRHQSLSASQA